MTNHPPYTPANEVRLGLVLYGGVSLAVYINGVTREFFRATRGQGVYALIKGLTDSDIAVDIVSGASAGGINGIFLAYALCNQVEFAGFADLWRDLGDISKLMRAPDRDPDQCQSLLDSEGYYEPNLAKAFTTLKPIDPELYEFMTAVPELDLFITGANVYGEISTVFDDSGDPIDVKNNRSVFQLKHRANRKEPFRASDAARSGEPDLTQQTLARLARLTSAFPAAFTPVRVAKAEPGLDSIDARLQLWGGLGGGEAYFMDGGVLDNKPFTSTLHEIYYRLADRKVERRLLYVEPAPERFAAVEKPEQPDFFRVISDALVSLPGYQSIGADLQDLNQHNSRVQQYNEVRASISGKAPSETKPGGEAQAAYTAARIIKLRDRALEGILDSNGKREMLRDPVQRKAASRLVKDINDIAAPPPPGLLRAFDVYMRLRRLFYLSYLLRDKLRDTDVPADLLRDVPKFRPALNYLIGVLDIIRTAMEDFVDQANFNWDDEIVGLKDEKTPASRIREIIGARVGNACEQLLDRAIFLPLRDCLSVHALGMQPKECGVDPASQLNARLRAKMDELCKKPLIDSTPLNLDAWRGMLDETDLLEEKVLAQFPASLNFAIEAYRNFENLDTYLYPLDMVSGLVGKDRILLTRVSPLDAQRGFCRRDYREKLAGAQFHNFGGFFKRSWRSNDLLWGRLDGLCQLVECVFTKDRLKNALASENMREWLTGSKTGVKIAKDHPCHPETLFQGAGNAGARLAGWIECLLGDKAQSDAALERFVEFQDLLTEAAHWKILQQDLGSVAADAIREQLDWNQFRVPADSNKPESLPFDAGAWAFRPGSGDFDPMVATLASVGSAESALKEILKPAPDVRPPSETRLAEYFKTQYQVGAERLDRDLPKAVLLQIYSTGALLARNCILTALGPTAAAKITKSPIYIVLLDAPLRLFHAVVSWLRRSPADRKWEQITLAVVSVVLLAIGMWWPFQSSSLREIAIFLLGPVAVLGALAFFVLRNRPVWYRWKQAALTVAGFAVLLGSAVWVRKLAAYASSAIHAKEAIFLFAMPVVAVGSFLLLAAELRSMFRARAARRREIETAVRRMNLDSLRRIAREFLLWNPPCVSAGDLAGRILAPLSVWPSGRAHRAKLESLIRRIDRDALPNTAPDLVKLALVNYFSTKEVGRIACDMGIKLKGQPRPKWARFVFQQAKKSSRLGELESRMREMHSMIL